ncbi:hypothetical protein IWX78_001960 [Mycetocola sp. CAN_C7]|uniref:hypothetical protein n=1 Tax=Mycetocola sp. CAN_C7 TaxID=2787724 RepID=UPI0018CA0C34
MKYTIEYDSAAWFPVPESFPDDTWVTEGAWLDSLVADFEADLGNLTDDARAAVHEFAIGARGARVAGTSQTLLFCPRTLPVLGMASIYVGTPDDVIDLDHEASADHLAQLPPLIEDFATDNLGAGRRAAVVIGASDGSSAAGRYNYAFNRDGCVVTVSGTADGLQDAALMQPFLDGLVRGIRLEP